MNRKFISLFLGLGVISQAYGCLIESDSIPDAIDKSQIDSDNTTHNLQSRDQIDNQQSASHTDDVVADSNISVPKAIPVLSLEDAKKANLEAIKHFEAQKKKIEEMEAKRREVASKIGGESKEELGYHLILDESFQQYASISINNNQEETLKEKGYDVSEFKQRNFPKQLSLDIAKLPQNTVFRKGENGFDIESQEHSIVINTPRYDSMGKSFLIELVVTNTSKEECYISLGANATSLSKTDYLTLQKQNLNPGESKTLLGYIDVYDKTAYITPDITIKGKITINSLMIYQREYSDFTILEGEIVERSSLPKPEEADYPNCRFTARFKGNSIISGKPCSKDIALSIDGFQDKELLGTNKLKPGDKIKCAIIPIDLVPEELASIQEADDLSLFELDSYLVTSILGISTFKSISSSERIGFKSETLHFKSVFAEPINEKIPDYLIAAQAERIKKDLTDATEMLSGLENKRDEIEKRFQKVWTKEKERFSDGYNTVGESIWRNINHSFWSLPKNYTFIPQKLKVLPQSKLDALVALKDFLEFHGIQLIVSFVPNWYDISSRIINQDFVSIPDYQTAIFVKQLSEAGIECPYIVGTLIKNYDKFSHAYLYPQDNHPGSTLQYSVSEVVSERIKDYKFPQTLDPDKFSHKQVLTYGGARPYHVYPKDCDIDTHEPGEYFTADQILYDGTPITPDKKSEILIVGNSSIEFPMGSPDALQAFLAERMRYKVDNLRVNATGPFTTVIQRFFDNPSNYLKGKKVVILQTMDFILTEETIPWNNIRTMDQQRMMLNGKKLVTSFSINGNGKWGSEINHEETRKRWESFGDKQEVKCLDDKTFEIVAQKIDNIDPSKPVLCVVQTLRSAVFKTPKCIVNGERQDIPAGYYVTELSWQNLSFELPQGTDIINISIQGQPGTIVGFNQVFIYQ